MHFVKIQAIFSIVTDVDCVVIRKCILMALDSRGGTGAESTPAGFCVFLSEPESKVCEKPDPESLFNFGSSRSLCSHFLGKHMGKLRLDRLL